MQERTTPATLMQPWTVKSECLNVLLVGNTGVGKSALVNSLAGRNVAYEGTDDARNIRDYNENVRGVGVTFWDTPGLRDPFQSDSKDIVRKIAEKCKFDVVLYCLPMTTKRLTQDDLESMTLLTRTFGEGVWMKTIWALTFANQIRPPPDFRGDLSVYFSKRVSEWATILQQALQAKPSVSRHIAANIPVVPMGYKENGVLPSDKNWSIKVWQALFLRQKTDSQQELAITFDHSDEAHYSGFEGSNPNREVIARAVGMIVIGAIVGTVIGAFEGIFGAAVGAGAGIAIGVILALFCRRGATLSIITTVLRNH